MFEAFLTNTLTEGLKPLGTAPQRSFELISETVRERFGDAHAALFAEPIATQYGDRFDWYATLPGKAVVLSVSENQEAARALLESMVSDIKGMAQTLSGSKLADDQRLGEALANALEIPDESSIFVVTNEGEDGETLSQPILVNWAWVRDEQVAVRGVLTGMDARPEAKQPGYVAPKPVPATAATSATAAAVGAAATGVGAIWYWLLWLGWLLLALLIAAVIYLLIEPCALRISWLPDTCPRVEVQKDTLAEERKILEDQIIQVEKEIGIKDRACQPDIMQLPIPEPPEQATLPEQPIDPDVDSRAEAAGALRGDLTFTLIWDSTDDLDIYLTCPRNETIFFLKKEVCGGVMDLDSNGLVVTQNPIENVYYTGPPTGNYRVRVNFYKRREGQGPRSFTLQIRDGDNVATQNGSVSEANPNWQYTYDYRN